MTGPAAQGVRIEWAQLPALVRAVGDTLLHADIRADNILLTRQGAMVVDWPWACRGAAFTDLVLSAPSVAMQGGPPPAGVTPRVVAGAGGA